MNYEATDRSDQPTNLIYGRNAALEAIKSEQCVDKLFVCVGENKGSIGKLIGMAKDRGIPVKDVTSQKLDAMCGCANHQGVAVTISAASYSELEDIYQKAKAQEEPLFVIIADEIEDPHNLGALIRTAECSGAHGIIIPKRRSAGLSPTVFKSSAGAASHLPVVRVPNLVSAIDDLKEHGCWIYCADMDGKEWCKVDYSGAVGLVVGNEGAGVGRLIKEKCDFTVSLPMLGSIESLNASVAGGIVMYEIARQRLKL